MAPLPYWVLFGDSITQYGFNREGWAAGLNELYIRKTDIVNRGHGGYNTRWALEIFDKLFSQYEGDPPALVSVFFGANDAALPDRTSAGQHVPLTEFSENLRLILKKLKELGVPRLVVIGAPPVDEPARIVYAKEVRGSIISQSERTNEAAGEYSAAAEAVARSEDVAFVELWKGFQTVSGWRSELLTDGLHLTAKGNDELLGRFLAAVKASWPELDADELRFAIPAFADFVQAEDPIAELRALVERPPAT